MIRCFVVCEQCNQEALLVDERKVRPDQCHSLIDVGFDVPSPWQLLPGVGTFCSWTCLSEYAGRREKVTDATD